MINPYPITTKLITELPEWCRQFILDNSKTNYPTNEGKMSLTLDLLTNQIQYQTGGPFSAIVFDPKGLILSIGVNLVVPSNNSTAHAEMIALQLAQKSIQNFSLNSIGECTLSSSSQPCAQCCGAGVWAGIKKLLVATTAEDTAKILGFDEGPIHPNWKEEYLKRGIEVITNIQQENACQIISQYKGIIYNGSDF